MADTKNRASAETTCHATSRFFSGGILNKLRWGITLSLVFAMLVLLPFLHAYQTYVAAHAYDLLTSLRRPGSTISWRRSLNAVHRRSRRGSGCGQGQHLVGHLLGPETVGSAWLRWVRRRPGANVVLAVSAHGADPRSRLHRWCSGAFFAAGSVRRIFSMNSTRTLPAWLRWAGLRAGWPPPRQAYQVRACWRSGLVLSAMRPVP